MPFKVVRGVARFVPLIRGRQIDIVDAWQHHGAALAAITRPVTGLPILFGGRRNMGDFRERFGPLERAMDRLATRSANVIVANSEVILERVVAQEHMDRSKLRMIHNGVEVPRLMSDAERERVRREWNVGSNDILVGCVSNYRGGKALDRLIRTVVEAHAVDPRLRLVLIGHGPLRPTFQALIGELGGEDIVVLGGHSPDAPWLCQAFDIFAHPSDAEGLPNAVLEAAAAGRPIVATAAGGTEEIVDDGRTGVLVPVGDTVSLGRGILRLASDEPLRTRLGQAARAHAIREFGMDRFVAETAALYEEMAGRHGAP